MIPQAMEGMISQDKWKPIEAEMIRQNYSDRQIASMKAQFMKMQSGTAENQPSAQARLGKGLMNNAQGIKQIGLYIGDKLGLTNGNAHNEYTKQINDEHELYKKNLGKDFGFDGFEFTGNVLPSIAYPFSAGKTLLTTALKSATGGGLLGGAQYAKDGVDSTEKAIQVTGGATGGAVAPLVVNPIAKTAGKTYEMANKGYNAIKNRFNLPKRVESEINVNLNATLKENGINFSQLNESVVNDIKSEIAKTLKAGNRPDTRAIVRKNVLNSMGFSGDSAPTKAQISRDANIWRDERHLSQTNEGAPLINRYSNQNNELRRLSESQANNIGGKAMDDIDASQQSFDDLTKKWNQSQSEISKAYQSVKDTGEIYTLDTLKSKIDELFDVSYEATVPQLKTVKGTLNKAYKFDENGNPLPISAKQAENIRKEIVKLYSTTDNRTEKTILKSLIPAIDDDLSRQSDVFANARNLASQRFKKFENKIVQSIINDKANESRFLNNYIYNGKPKDIEELKILLDEQNWRNLKGRVYDRLMDKAFGGNRNSESATFSGKMLLKEINRIGDSRLKSIFTPEELNSIKQRAQAGEWLNSQPPFSAVNNSGTGAYVSDTLRDIMRNAGMQADNWVSAIPKMSAQIKTAKEVNSALNSEISPLQKQEYMLKFLNNGYRYGNPPLSMFIPGLLSQSSFE